MKKIQALTERCFLWDDARIDKRHTTAERRQFTPVRRENTLVLDKPWEGDGCDYHHTVYDKKKHLYRMYYLGMQMFHPDGTLYHTSDVRVCCLESRDAIHWKRPNLGIVCYNGSTDNNIVLESSMLPELSGIDNFFVAEDTRPDPPVKGRFKAVMLYTKKCPDGSTKPILASFTSDDGYHFERFGTVTEEGRFDTLNTILWHEKTGQYLCYIRSFHDKDTGAEYDPSRGISLNDYVRDIRVLRSVDFIHWTKPERLRLSSREDFPLYTNCVSVYPGSSMLVGLPTRYNERHEWTDAFEVLCGREKRLERMKKDRRFGLALTDCLFMCSADGVKWTISDEAFLRPGPEQSGNWVYGSCYPSVGFIETPSSVKGEENELSFYAFDNHWMSDPTVLYRMTLRKDGFVSRHAGYAAKKVTTKPFLYEGGELHLNFSTSARGYVKAVLTDIESGVSRSSCEFFGDSTDKPVSMGDLSAFTGKAVRLELTLSDADVFAFEFR